MSTGQQFLNNYLRLERLLLDNMKREAPRLRETLGAANDHWGYEDGMYRFYHQSFKVYDLQSHTTKIVGALKSVAPDDRPFCGFFQAILAAGTGRVFTLEANERWVEEAGPMTLAFLHARYFLEMAVKYSELEEPPQFMPSGWAAVLSLFDLR
ncbi:MAG TPA: hypothetical protein VHQ47_02290 [Phycisphaerae bacterium]|nr:hypothetical protein [Phycisphaerae bacterium]